MSRATRVTLVKTAPDALAAFGSIEEMFATCPVDPLLRHLVKLRISQINGCAYCVNMHTGEARDDNETEARLDHLVVWRNTDLFSAAEKAALAWAEAMTVQGSGADLDLLHGELKVHFSQDEIDYLTLIIMMINTWNRLQVSNHNAAF
jgi:AhpD family alkylhydroperoxidase